MYINNFSEYLCFLAVHYFFILGLEKIKFGKLIFGKIGFGEMKFGALGFHNFCNDNYVYSCYTDVYK